MVSYTTIVVVLGMVALTAGLWMGLVGAVPRFLSSAGVLMTTIGLVAGDVTLTPPRPPLPTPQPSPTPPVPQPVTPFGQAVMATFQAEGGTPQQAAELSALHTKMAEVIDYDGRQQSPLLKTTNDLGRSFALLQQYHFLSNPTPLANLFPRLEAAIAAEATQRQIIGPDALPVDASRRAAAVQYYREIGAALARVAQRTTSPPDNS